ncbi:MAG: hypothetical protein NDF51_05475 [archaeon YNP-WB-040]|nr:hypothetical protein [Candidatus Verstraetearchaeota archaeon]MCR6669430.1 hypothetical protein [Candidatus Culexarchaeum yellowstonense]
MQKVSYGFVAFIIALIYFGVIFIMFYLGFHIGLLDMFSGFLLALSLWTLTYGLKFASRDSFWIVNGFVLMFFSASMLVFSLTGSGLLSIGVLLFCLGILGLLMILR